MSVAWRLLLCAALCALTLACSGDRAPLSPTLAPSATAIAALADTLPRSLPFTPPAAEPTATATPEAPAAATVLATSVPAPTPAARPAPVTLRLTLETADQTFEPHQVHGNLDDIVILTLHGSDERHSFTVPVLGIDQTIDRDKTVVVDFVLPLALIGPNAEAIFPFYCRFHGSPTAGMHGFLIFH